MEQKISDDVFLYEWDWQESPDWDIINKIIQDNLGRIIKFHKIETGSDGYAVIISFNRILSDTEAKRLYKKIINL